LKVLIQIDTPRQYRLEKLPRALPWETVRSLLESIDRKTPLGLRDYAIFLLMATYGLRPSDIVNLKMDAIHWRHDESRSKFHLLTVLDVFGIPMPCIYYGKAFRLRPLEISWAIAR
jgi:integrase